MTAIALLRIRKPHTRTYHSVAFAQTRLNEAKNALNGPPVEVFGRSNNAASAGLNVNALKADRITENAMVTANCWYRRPVIPGMKAVGQRRQRGPERCRSPDRKSLPSL